MTLQDGCYSLKLECALRELGFVDIGWKCGAHAVLCFVQPYGIPDNPEGDLIGFSIIKSDQVIKLVNTAKRALDYCLR